MICGGLAALFFAMHATPKKKIVKKHSMPDQLPRKRRADASTTTAHERHSRYSILKHATRNIEYQRCAKRKTTQLTQKGSE